MTENWGRLQEQLAERGARREVERATAAVEDLRSAGLSAQLGEESEARDHLSDALRGIRHQANRLEGPAGERWRQLADETTALAISLEAGIEAARTLSELAAQAEALAEELESDAPDD
ncbi:hypothetical protein JXA47_05385 [Candidatus Sumerlaeota bacterium]|nr:hypothetical protein [Candidatus Sumerlaeota bacterium]